MSQDLAADIASALRREQVVLSSFENLPPSHKREYLDWIDEAKKPETRARRIEQMIERLRSPGRTA